MGISKIEVITSQNKLSALKITLAGMGVSGITAIQGLGCGVQHGTQEYEVEVHDQMELLPKQYIMILVEDEKVEKVTDLIMKELYSGHIGDGKIVITPVSKVIRIRTGEEGTAALS